MAKFPKKKRPNAPEERAGGILTTDYVVSGGKVMLFQAALIIAVGLWIYWPAMNGGWLWDDDVYITKNPLMNDPARLWKAWFQPGSFMEYYPIEQTVQWFQWQLWGDDTFGYHLTNVILHIINALLVWRLLGKLRLPLAWLGGLIFVSHPLNVESVAWIVELKNTLSLAPFLLAMCAWIDYDEGHRPRGYWLALGLFLVAMLCKLTMAPFPVVILLYAWWKRGRIGWGDLRASAPFFAISLALYEVSRVAGGEFGQSVQMGSSGVLPVGGTFSCVVLSGLALSFYFSSCFLPLKLLPVYPVWQVGPASPLQLLPWFVLAGVIYWLWCKRKTWGRHALLGLGFFLLFIAPFAAIGLVFHPRDGWVMDHFLYIPIIGLIGVVVAAIGAIDRRLSQAAHPLSTGAITLVVVLLAFQAHGYAGAFTNEETLWTYTLEHNPGAWVAHNNLGKSLLMQDRLEEARAHFEAALRANPANAQANANLGVTLVQMGLMQEGIEQFKKALIYNPNDAPTHNNLGVALAETGHIPEALKQFDEAIQVQPNYAAAHNSRGNILLLTGKLTEAGAEYEQALKLDPHSSDAYANHGNVLLKTGHPDQAMADLDQALKLAPNNVTARNLMAQACRQQGLISEAIAEYQMVLEIDPGNEQARAGLKQLQKAQPGPSGK